MPPPTRRPPFTRCRAIEGGRITLEGNALPRRSAASCSAVRVGDRPARVRLRLADAHWRPSFRRESATRAACPCASTAYAGETGVRHARRAVRDWAASGRQSGVRSRRQPLRHLQRHARPAGAGVDLPRAPERHARDVLLRHREPDVDGHRSATAGCTYRAASRARSIGWRPTAPPSRSRPIWASRAGWPSTPTGRCMSAIARARSSRSIATDTRRTVRDAAGERRRVSPCARTRSHAVCDRADALVLRRDLSHRSRRDRQCRVHRIRPAARACLRCAPARCSSSTRSRGTAASIACRTSGPPELVLAGPGLVGVAFDPSGGLVVCSNDTAYRLSGPHAPMQ